MNLLAQGDSKDLVSSYKNVFKLSKIILPKSLISKLMVCLFYQTRRMGEVYFGIPGTSDCDIMSHELPKNVHVIMLQRQIVQLPTGERCKDVCDNKWSIPLHSIFRRSVKPCFHMIATIPDIIWKPLDGNYTLCDPVGTVTIVSTAIAEIDIFLSLTIARVAAIVVLPLLRSYGNQA